MKKRPSVALTAEEKAPDSDAFRDPDKPYGRFIRLVLKAMTGRKRRGRK